jgi:hypothetical protein
MAPSEELRVAVITPYYREQPETLRVCHESVKRQTYPCVHFMVADGFPSPEVARWPVEHIALSKAHRDNGDTPRGIGSLSAMNLGYDAIAYLDADNWFFENHIESMVSLYRRTGAAVCTASRTIHRLDGSLMYADRYECDGKKHVDTSCFFLTREAFSLLPIWAMMPGELGPVCDIVFWRAILERRLPCAHNPQPTVAFRTQYQVHYANRGETPPPGSKSNAESTGKAMQWWRELPEPIRDQWRRRLGSRLW